MSTGIGEREHARLSPSSAHRWMRCPGSVRLSEGKDGPATIYSAEGTVAHKVLEKCLTTGANAVGFYGQIFETDGFEIVVDQEMVDGVQMAVDYVRRFEAPGIQRWVERRDGLDKIKDLPEPIWGTTDVCVWDAETRTLHIIDFKYGRGVLVEVPDNEQLMIYALTQVLRVGERPSRIVLHVVQPRAHHADGPIRTHEVTYEDLVEFKKRLVEAARACQDPNAPLVPGDHCRFCPALPECPAHQKLAIEVAQEEFSGEPLPAPADLEPDRIAFILRHAATVEAWLKAVREHATAVLAAGGEIPGFKAVRGRSVRRWRDEEAAEKYLARAGLKMRERRKVEVISVAEAEKKLKKLGKELPGGLWDKPEGKLTVVPEADARPAVMSAQDEFGALPDSTDSTKEQ